MLKRLFLFLMLATAGLNVSAADADYNVVPLPQNIAVQKGKAFVLSSSTPIVYVGKDEQMKRNAAFLAEYIKQVTGMDLKVSGVKVKKTAPIVLMLDKRVSGEEAYKLIVTAKQITISASTPAGVFYGIQTLRKALPVLDTPEAVALPSVIITDAPRFGYRGLMLDCGRHFFPVSFIKKYIDMMALHNMNVFHWHLTEDQGWRLEMKKHPELTEIGSKRSGTVMGHNSQVDDGQPYGGFYTQEQAKDIVEYARERNIMVIPEVDMPGHTLAVLATYPELGCTGGPYEVGHKWGVYDEVLCLGNKNIYKLLEDVIDELVEIFPAKYIHIGGDETPTKAWESCPKCLALAKSQNIDVKHLQQYFTNRMEKYINSKGRKIIGWDEILEGEISPTATIMSWRGVEPGSKAAELGHDVIMSPNTYVYFDYYQSKDQWNEPMCIGGYLPVEKVYELDPAPESLSPKARKHILGAQANLWTEYIPYPNMAEYMVLPRMAALAESQWTPQSKKDYKRFYGGVTRMRKLYDRLGYHYADHIWQPKKENK